MIILRISVETFVRIRVERSRYAHDPSKNQVGNELEREQVVTFVPDRKRRAKGKVIRKNKFHFPLLLLRRELMSDRSRERLQGLS